jgi:hypothetical protein
VVGGAHRSSPRKMLISVGGRRRACAICQLVWRGGDLREGAYASSPRKMLISVRGRRRACARRRASACLRKLVWRGFGDLLEGARRFSPCKMLLRRWEELRCGRTGATVFHLKRSQVAWDGGGVILGAHRVSLAAQNANKYARHGTWYGPPMACEQQRFVEIRSRRARRAVPRPEGTHQQIGHRCVAHPFIVHLGHASQGK